ncbi:MAG: HAMP domain-containing histidine kinase [SAR202 cluster bacterium]|nr:HAMP domain-containing histidine kinase [SAR202 cluster bacterium]
MKTAPQNMTAAKAQPWDTELMALVAWANEAQANRLMAKGLIHDINNLLQVISGTIDLVTLSNERPGSKSMLDSLKGVTLDIKEMVKRLSVKEVIQNPVARQVVLLDKVLTEAIRYVEPYRLELARIYGADVKAKIELHDHRPLIGDEVLLRSALVNLLINALDAMNEKGGTLTVASSPRESMTEVLVSDTGTGINPEDQARIFEPFFSGKGNAHTGIGLTVVKHVVSAHGGRISFKSKAGKGTTFSILLPAVQQP